MSEEKTEKYLIALCQILATIGWSKSYGSYYPTISEENLNKMQVIVKEVLDNVNPPTK